MTTIGLLLLVAAAAFGIATRLRLPAVPLLIIAGILLHVSGGVSQTDDVLENVVVLGLAFLVFVTGAELNPRRVGAQKSAAFTVGISQFTLMLVFGLAVARFVGLGWLESVYVGVALAASSTLVVVRSLMRQQRFFEPFGRLVVGVLLLQDVVVIVAISVLSHATDGLVVVESALLRTIALGTLAWLTARHVTPILLTQLGLDEEGLLIVVLGVLFVFVGAAWMLNVPLVAGAFFAGFAVSSFPVNGVIRGQLTSLSDFFLAVFFTGLGASLGAPTLEVAMIAGVFIVAVFVLTPLVVVVVGERAGLSARASIEAGLLLAQTSELSLVVALVGVESGHVSPETMAVIALVTVVTMTLTPLVANDRTVWKLVRMHPARRATALSEHTGDAAGRVVVLGGGPNTLPIVEDLIERGASVMVIDEDPSVVDAVTRTGAVGVRADAADLLVLEQVGADRSRAIVSTLHRVADNCAIAKRFRTLPVIVRVFETDDAEAMKAAGAIPVRFYDATADEFFRWFDEFDGVVHAPEDST